MRLEAICSTDCPHFHRIRTEGKLRQMTCANQEIWFKTKIEYTLFEKGVLKDLSTNVINKY